MNILLIEDNPGDARLIQEMLKEAGNSSTVHIEESLGQGLAFLRFRGVDVVLLDMNLPDSRGLDTFTTLHGDFPDLPVVIMTGLADEELAVQAVRRGAQDYLVKGQVHTPGGALRRALLYAIERKQAEELIRFQSLLVDSTHDAIISATLNQRGEFITRTWNRGAEILYGWQSEEVVGRPTIEFLQPEFLPPGTLDNYLKQFFEQGSWKGEVITKRKDGSKLTVLTSQTLLKDNAGTITGAVGIHHDITDLKKAEAALQVSEAKYRNIVETAQEGIWTIDTEFKTSMVNQRMAQMLGYTVAEMVGKPVFRFIDEKGADIVRQNDLRRQQNIAESYEFEFIRKDGARLHSIIAASPIVDEEGRYAGSLGIVTDITERKRAEELTRYHATLLGNLAAAVVSVNREGTILSWNKGAEEIYGWEAEEVIGKRAAEVLMPRFFESREEEEEEEEEEVITQLQTAGQWRGEAIHKKRDGRDSRVFASLAILRDAAGNITGSVGVYRDMTDLRMAQEALRKSEADYRRLIELAAEGIVVVSAEGRLTFVNKQMADTIGYSQGEMLGRSLFDFIPGSERDWIASRWENLKNGIAPPYELELKRRDGSLLWLGGTVSPIFDDQGQFAGCLTMTTDITERKQREAEVMALLESTRAVLELRTFIEAAKTIFESCKKVTGATGGYIVLLNDAGTEYDLLFIDTGGLPCNVDPSLPMPIRGMRAEVYRTGKTYYHNDFPNSDWQQLIPPGHTPLENVLFAPLIIEGRSVGLLGLGNKPGGFTDDDVRLATSFADLASIALQNSRNLEAVQASEMRFRTVVETATDAIITVNKEGRIVLWNRSAENIFGYSIAEATGMPLEKLVPERYREAHLKGVAQVFAANEPWVSTRTLELVARHKDGSEAQVEVSLSAWKTHDELFITGVVRDISERKQLEEERRHLTTQIDKQREKAEELAYLLGREKTTLDTIMAHTGAHLVYLDQHFHFVKANRAYIEACGHTEEELIGRDHFELFPNEENRAIFERVRDTGETAHFHDKPFVYADQPERGVTYWDWTLVPVKNDREELQGLVFSLVETTARVLAEEKLRSYERLATLGRVGGSISHELRNPLGVIDSSVFYLDMQVRKLSKTIPEVTSERMKTHLERIHSGVHRSTAIIQSLLDLTQMKPARMDQLDMKMVTADTLRTSKIPGSVSVAEHYPAQDVFVNADNEQLRMAFKNIITNAVQAMDGEGTLSVTIRTVDGQAEVSFADTGPGIPPENLDRIFEPLFSTKAKGIGFGLTIVQMIAERFGGSVTAQSNLGQGATLIFRLPVAGG